MKKIGDFAKFKAYLKAHTAERLIEQAVTQANTHMGNFLMGLWRKKSRIWMMFVKWTVLCRWGHGSGRR